MQGQYSKSSEQREKISSALKNKPKSPEAREKMKASALKRWEKYRSQQGITPPTQLEESVRPTKLEEFIGFDSIKQEMKLMAKAAKQLNAPIFHCLITGEPGTGKSSLAQLLASLAGGPIIQTHASLLKKPVDLRNLFIQLNRQGVNDTGKIIGPITPTTIILDEIHTLGKKNPECLYAPMEDRIFPWRSLDPDSGEITLTNFILPPLLIIGISTRAGELPQPLLDRFKIHFHLELYTIEELEEILRRVAQKLSCSITPEAIHQIAVSSKGVPRIALAYLDRIRTIQIANQHATITKTLVEETFELIGVYEDGLTKQDIAILQYLYKIKPNKVGLGRLATIVGESVKSFSNSIEPFLLREGLLHVAPGGRMSGPKTRDYLKRNHFLPHKETDVPMLLEK